MTYIHGMATDTEGKKVRGVARSTGSMSWSSYIIVLQQLLVEFRVCNVRSQEDNHCRRSVNLACHDHSRFHFDLCLLPLHVFPA